MPGRRPILLLGAIGAVALIACCVLIGGGAIADSMQTAIAISR